MRRLPLILVALSLSAHAGKESPPAAAPANAGAALPVATATLVAGPVIRRAANGTEQPLSEGALLYEGDQIETGSGALVHLTFTDQAKVALRPHSLLIIERYRTATGQEALELALPRGTVRQITGEAAHRAPEKYRLATPIAAIGVRGTDFAVRSLPNATETLLHQGSILLAHAAQCPTLPCPAAITITLDQPAWRITADGTAHPIPPAELPKNHDLTAQNGKTDRAASSSSNTTAARSAEPSAALTETPASTEPAAPPPPPEQLRWGRWFAVTPDGLTRERYDELKAAGLVPAIANSRYVLMREEPTATLIPTTGRFTFQLTEARAQLVQYDWFTDPAQINNATLTIDFAARTYQTSATLAHPQVGSYPVAAAGEITPEGRFADYTATTQVMGALTPHGTQAGILYEVRPTATTRLEGLTLWRKP